jgi:hypothetical protein
LDEQAVVVEPPDILLDLTVPAAVGAVQILTAVVPYRAQVVAVV